MMSTVDSRFAEVPTWELVEEIAKRDQLWLALAQIRARLPWWWRFRLGERVWGLSGSWFAICPWNGDTAWITLPFIYLGAGAKSIELGLGHGNYHLNFEIRWRWD